MTDYQRILLLRQYTLCIFRGVLNALQGYTSETNSSTDSFGKTVSVVQERERQLLNAELSLAITAPMKAGKSTILNSIIGDGILPSRALAMTVLPTKVQLCPDREEPMLCLSQAFNEAIKQFLDNDDYKELDWGDNGHVIGAQRIRQALTILNDKVRVGLQQNKAFKMPLDGRDIPVVYAKLPEHLQNSSSDKRSMPHGSLVLIDTPGPNEASIGEALQLIVRDILQQVSMVGVVLDYTQLTSEAAELTKNEVMTIASIMGKENVVYLVNKVDQRRTGDLTTKQVEDFISKSYAGSVESNVNLFEVSASKGYAAGSFIRAVEGQDLPDEDMRTMPCAISLAQELYELWEDELADATVDHFQKKANRLWSNSGIEQFLSVCIEELANRAYEKTVYTSIDFLSNQLQQIEEQLNLQINASSSSRKRINEQIKLLEVDMSQVENARSQSRLIQDARKNVEEQIRSSIAKAKRSAKLTITDVFNDRRQAADTGRFFSDPNDSFGRKFGNKLSVLQDSLANMLRRLSDDLSSLGDFLLGTGNGKLVGNKLEFSSRHEADRAMHQIKETLNTRVDTYVRATKTEVENEVTKAQTGIMEFTQQNTQKVLRNAQSRLNEAFTTKLSLPPPTLRFTYDLGGVNVEPGEVRRLKAGKIVLETKEDDRWYTLWGFFGLIKRTVPVQLPDEEYDVYVINMEDVVEDVNTSIDRGFSSIEQIVKRYISEDLEASVGEYYAAVNDFLCRYQKSLQVAQEQASKSAEEQSKMMNSSRKLKDAIEENKNKIANMQSGELSDACWIEECVDPGQCFDEHSIVDMPIDPSYSIVQILDEEGVTQAAAFLYDSERSVHITEMMRREHIIGSDDFGRQTLHAFIGDSAAGLAPTFAAAVQAGQVLRIVGPPLVAEGLANGSMALMQSGTNSLGTIVSNASGSIVGQAQFSPAGAVVAPLMIYQVVHAIAGTQQLNQINRRLAVIEQALSRIIERQNAKDLGEVIAACTTLSDILDEHSNTGHFSPQMQDRLSHCERDLRSHYERLKYLKSSFSEKIAFAKRSSSDSDSALELAILINQQGEQFGQDMRLLFALSAAVLHLEHSLLLVALEHNPTSLGYRNAQLSQRIIELRAVFSEMVDIPALQVEIKKCLEEMAWWQRAIFQRSKTSQLEEALALSAHLPATEPRFGQSISAGEGVVVWFDPDHGMQARGITRGVINTGF